MNGKSVVIVGGGYGGCRAIDCLRRAGFKGRITLITAEDYLPYHRPPLSKKFLTEESGIERILLRHPQHFHRQDAEIIKGVKVEKIDPEGKRVSLSGGEVISYDKLLLCLGSKVRKLNVEGGDVEGVHYLRTFDDAIALRDRFKPGRKLVVVGAGYVGLEVAATARSIGLDVTVVEYAARPMSRVASPFLSDYFTKLHESNGVNFVFNAAVTGFRGDRQVESVMIGDGSEIPADIVVVGVGNSPETDLAEEAGLSCDNGIIVDEYCRTSDPNIYAAGDCTNHPSVRFGDRIRLESVDNAIEQARIAAENICGRQVVHDHVPWFWSDQYDKKLEIVGLSANYDGSVVRGIPDSGQFSIWYFKKDRLLSVEAINAPKDFIKAGKLISASKLLDRAMIADESIDLYKLLEA